MEVEKLPERSRTQMEDSGSSGSSVVNGEIETLSSTTPPSNGVCRDEDSSNNINTSSAFIFDILKKEKDGLAGAGKDWNISASPGVVTRSFFPVTGDNNGGNHPQEVGSCSSSTSTTRPQWLNLSFTDSGGGGGKPAAELKVLQQKQQTKKSRRGPRSRSSQYRGVTFYRRTGRWESHIWCVIFHHN